MNKPGDLVTYNDKLYRVALVDPNEQWYLLEDPHDANSEYISVYVGLVAPYVSRAEILQEILDD